MFLNNKAYGVLKWIALVLLPAVGALYFGLAQIWGLPNAEEVIGTVTVVDTFLGVLLGLSTKAYNNSDAKYDGSFDVEPAPGGRKIYSLELKPRTEETLESKDELRFKINNPS